MFINITVHVNERWKNKKYTQKYYFSSNYAIFHSHWLVLPLPNNNAEHEDNRYIVWRILHPFNTKIRVVRMANSQPIGSKLQNPPFYLDFYYSGSRPI